MAIEFEGMDKILDALEDIGDPQTMAIALGKACALVERAAKQKAPKDTGELRRSITSRVDTLGNEVVGVVYTPLEYAPYIEYGTGIFAETGGRQDVPWHYKDDKGEWHTTSGQQPQPFMRPAFNENREQILRIFKEALKDD